MRKRKANMASNNHSHQHLTGPALVAGGPTLEMEFPRLRFSTSTTGSGIRRDRADTFCCRLPSEAVAAEHVLLRLCASSSHPCPPLMPAPDMELDHWVTGSVGHLGHLSRPGHRVIILTRRETRVFFRFSKKCPKCKTEMQK